MKRWIKSLAPGVARGLLGISGRYDSGLSDRLIRSHRVVTPPAVASGVPSGASAGGASSSSCVDLSHGPCPPPRDTAPPFPLYPLLSPRQ